jgi:hypothetical protein
MEIVRQDQASEIRDLDGELVLLSLVIRDCKNR